MVEPENGNGKDFNNQWMLDVNDRYERAVGVVVSLSTASLVLPIIFLKDIVQIDSGKSFSDYLTCSVYIGWGLLALSVIAGIVYYFASAKWVKIAWDKKTDICNRAVTKDDIEGILDKSYLVMMLGFVLGLFCIIIYMATFTITQ